MRMNPIAPRNGPMSSSAAFSLIEVNMALLVVGVGLAALLGLFPAALREGGLASADTSQAMFADQILNMLHANASTTTNWTDWNNPSFTMFLEGATPSASDNVSVPDYNNNPVPITQGRHIISDYLTQGTYIEYELHLEYPTANHNIVRAWLRVGDRKSSDILKNPIYMTEFIFMGM